MSREGRSEEDVRQRRGFLFEACKHLTTLDTASALVLLALHRDTGLTLVPLGFFGASLVAATYGMVAVTLDWIEEGEPAQGYNSLGLVAAATAFVAGVLIAFTGVVIEL